jgi:uncharacterized membrane protein
MTEVQRFLARFEGWIVLLLAALYFTTYATLSILRHQTFHSFGPDLGIFDQIFWNTVHGRWFESTMSLAQPRPHSYFGDHFSPVYVLLLPFYAVFPHPQTLLVIQTLFLAAGVLPLYLLARLRLPAGYPRLTWVIAYLLFIPLAYVNLYDFHETALSVLPLGLALYFLERGRPGLFVASLLFTLLIKEEMALIGMGFGAYALAGKRDWRLGLAVLLGSLAAFFAIVRLIIPAFAGGSSYAYFSARYAQFGSTPAQIVETALTHPLRLLRTLAQAKKLAFLAGLFGPVLGLSAVSGFAVLILLPPLSYLLLSNYEPQFSFTNQYAAPLIPLVLGTAVLGISRLPAAIQRWLTAGILLSSLLFATVFGDLPFSRRFDRGLFRPESRYSAFASALAAIPPEASVAAENDLTPHLSNRRLIYDIEYEGLQPAQFVALDMAATGRNRAAFDEQIRTVMAAGYRELASGDGLALFERP